ncbi:MAG: hypothetical protein KatS3mg031_1017 [Chitinophagales bacterium]|nr:MAG: hypothetical protein KatS3mg031_1017 [Chitinophagales bacterium]
MRKKDRPTEERILQAAKKIFQQKGMMGARMQEIADEAGINKALLHYYFRNKEKLHERVLYEAISQVLPVLGRILSEDIPLFEKIERYVEEYISLIAQREYLPAFVIHELNMHPGKLIAFIRKLENRPDPSIFFRQVQREVQAGNIRPIRPEHLLVNMLSLCVFPFLIQPMLVKGLGYDKKHFDKLMAERKKEVARFIIQAIQK